MQIQPQLVLLQKTLLNIEGLGRQLDPDLDLWKTGKPFLERWMNEQFGWRGLLANLRKEAPNWAVAIPQIPRLAHHALAQAQLAQDTPQIQAVLQQHQRTMRWLWVVVALLASGLALLGWLVVTTR